MNAVAVLQLGGETSEADVSSQTKDGATHALLVDRRSHAGEVALFSITVARCAAAGNSSRLGQRAERSGDANDDFMMSLELLERFPSGTGVARLEFSNVGASPHRRSTRAPEATAANDGEPSSSERSDARVSPRKME